MATKSLDKQMGEFMSPATDEAPTMGAMDVNTPASAREGLPLRLFDKSRTRYETGDVVKDNIVKDDDNEYNKALNVFHLMARENKTPQEIKSRIGENMYNKIIMNKMNKKQELATGGFTTDPNSLDPRFGKYFEQPEYKAYAEGGEVEEDMVIPELQEGSDMNMQVDTMMTPSEEGEEPEMEVSANIDMSVLDAEEEQLLEEVIEMHPDIVDVIIKLSAKEFTGEGEVDGPGTGTSDSIPAMLSDGEFVFTAKAVKQIGVDKLRNMMAKAEQDYDTGMGEQEANQEMSMNQPMMAKGGLLSTGRFK
jgi:hypothetical protein